VIHVSALGGGRARLVTGFDGPVADVAEELARLAADEVPSVAAIAGRCVGPAFELALACDLRLAADSAIVSADGVVDVTGCARRLARLLGEARAKDLLLTGRAVGAAEALRAKGALEIYGACTHPILSGKALERISASVVSKVYVTDSIPINAPANLTSKIEVLTVSELFGEAIRRGFSNQSISSLFDVDKS